MSNDSETTLVKGKKPGLERKLVAPRLLPELAFPLVAKSRMPTAA